jgi:hypothetical protein
MPEETNEQPQPGQYFVLPDVKGLLVEMITNNGDPAPEEAQVEAWVTAHSKAIGLAVEIALKEYLRTNWWTWESKYAATHACDLNFMWSDETESLVRVYLRWEGDEWAYCGAYEIVGGVHRIDDEAHEERPLRLLSQEQQGKVIEAYAECLLPHGPVQPQNLEAPPPRLWRIWHVEHGGDWVMKSGGIQQFLSEAEAKTEAERLNAKARRWRSRHFDEYIVRPGEDWGL